MKTIVTALLCALPLTLLCQPTNFKEPISGSRQLVDAALGDYPGVAVAVAVNGELVWSEGFGFADIDGKVRMHPDQGVRLYSLSKTITGLALAQLEDRSVLDLSKHSKSYLPQLSATLNPVLVVQLVNHSSGIRHYKKGEWMKISQQHCATTKEAIALFSTDPIGFEPGSKFQYSSFGYVLLCGVMEAAAGSDFRTIIRETVFKPAGVNLFFDKIDSDTSRVKFYEPKGKKFKLAESVDNSCKFGGGGMNGSVNDVAKLFMTFLSDRSPISSATRSRLLTALPLNDGLSSKYGYGWQVLTPASGDPFVVNTGSGMGGASVLCYYPATQTIVVMATNMDNDEFYKLGLEVGKLFNATPAKP